MNLNTCSEEVLKSLVQIEVIIALCGQQLAQQMVVAGGTKWSTAKVGSKD